MCGLSEVFELSLFQFFADLLVCLRCPHGLIMYFVFPLCIFKPTFRLSEFRLFMCFSICFVVSFKRATSSANLKLLRFSPSTLTPLEISAFLNTSSITAVNSLGESGSPCLTPLCIGNSVDTNLSRWTLAVA